MTKHIAKFFSVLWTVGLLLGGSPSGVHLFAQNRIAVLDDASQDLPRDRTDLVYYLALQQGSGWKVYPPNPSGEPYEIEAGLGELELYWSVPAYPDSRNQTALIRSSYAPQQTILLYRRGPGGFFARIFGRPDREWHGTLAVSKGLAGSTYVDFHGVNRRNLRK